MVLALRAAHGSGVAGEPWLALAMRPAARVRQVGTAAGVASLPVVGPKRFVTAPI